MDDPRAPHLKGLARPKVHHTTVPLPPPGDVLHQECVALWREMPRLLAEGHEGKFALLKGAQLIGIFDDEDEVMRVGRQTYLMQPFRAQPILEWITVLYQSWRCWPCQSSPSSKAQTASPSTASSA